MFFIAVLLEIGWEILENSPLIIERYRSETISLDYTGDSVLNSCGDLACAIAGFWIAWRVRWYWVLGLLVAVELAMLALYRDNLALNVLMLAAPVPAVREWQMGAQ
jgi:hypothetical protein